MLKLTRLNGQTILLNADHIAWAEASPDTTLFLLSGEKVLVRESHDELVEKVIAFRQRVRNDRPSYDPSDDDLRRMNAGELPRLGDPPAAPAPPSRNGMTDRPPRRATVPGLRTSSFPRGDR